MNRTLRSTIFCLLVAAGLHAQFTPKNISEHEQKTAKTWVENTYKALSQDEKLGQLFIVALYTNKGEEHISSVRNLVEKEKLGGLILMQDDAAREIDLVNEFQAKSKIPMLIGMMLNGDFFSELLQHINCRGP